MSLFANPSPSKRITSSSAGVSASQPPAGRFRPPWPRSAYAIASAMDSPAPSAHAASKSLSPSALRTESTEEA